MRGGLVLLIVGGLTAPGPAGESLRLLPALRQAVDAALPSPQGGALQDEPTGEVTVDYSPRSPANLALTEALRLEQAGDWSRAADIYQRLLGEPAGTLCQVSPRLYRPVGAYALERLSAFPDDFLRAHRKSVATAADAAYADAIASGSLDALQRVSRQFLLSHRGDDALDRLATAWLARGQPGRAVRAWERLLRFCPGTDLDLSVVAVKLAVALQQLGRVDAAADLLDGTQRVLGRDVEVVVAGQSRSLASVLSVSSRPYRVAHDEASWPLLGGDASQSRASSMAVRPGGLAWSQQLHARNALQPERPPFVRYPPSSLPRRGAVNVLPVVAGGLAIYPSRQGVQARHVATGKLAWETPWPSYAEHYLHPFTSQVQSTGTWTCSVSDDQVFCCIPLENLRITRAGMQADGELMALDLRTGAPTWRLSAESVVPKLLETGWFTSPPTPVDEALVLGLRAGEGGFEYHLCAVSASDGRLLWRTFLAGRPASPYYGRYGSRRWFEASPAARDGIAVVDTEAGALAAVDAATGKVLWLSRYDQRAEGISSVYYAPVAGWRSTGPAISGGVVYAAPPSSDFAYAIDLGSGRQLWRRQRGENVYMLAHDSRAYLIGSGATCLDARGNVVWEAPLSHPAVGRPVLADQVLHIPLERGLIFLDARSGHVLHKTQWAGWQEEQPSTWTAHIASGDLLVAVGHLFACTQYTLNAFAPYQPLPDIERALAAEPGRAELHLTLGLELRWSGDLVAAAESLEKALAFDAQTAAPLSEEQRAEARQELAATYSQLSREHELAGQTAAALRTLRAALHHSPDHASPDLLLRIASLCEQARHWDDAVDACQQVLAAAEPFETTWRSAREHIARILDARGPAPYARHERAAAAVLARKSTEALEQVVRLYPNSRSAPTALLLLAEHALGAGQPGQSRAWLHHLARDYPASGQAPSALYRLALGHAAEGGEAMARGALETLRARYPDWRTSRPEGVVASRIRPDEFLRAHAPAPAEVPPPPSPPFRVAWTVRQDYGSSELYVRSGAPGDAGSLYFLVGLGLESRSPADGSPRWADRPGWLGISIEDSPLSDGGVLVRDVIPDTPAHRAGFRTGDILTDLNGQRLRNTRHLISRCKALRAGTTVTTRFLRDGEVRSIEVVLGERPTQSRSVHLTPDSFAGVVSGNVLFRREATLHALRIADGRRAWSKSMGDDDALLGEPARHLTVAAPGIVVTTADAGRLIATDPANGRHLWTTQPGEPTIHQLALSAQGLVVASSRPATIRVMNAFTGEELYADAAPRAVSPPVFALDARLGLCYGLGSRLVLLRRGAGPPDWSVQTAGLQVSRVLLADTSLVVQGDDAKGVSVFQGHRLSDGAVAWTFPLVAGEDLTDPLLEPGALYLLTRRGAVPQVRRLDVITGRVVWTADLPRDIELASCEVSGPSVMLGVTRTSATGQNRAELYVLDKRSGAASQQLVLHDGAMVALARIGSAYYAVIENAHSRALPQRHVLEFAVESPRFHVTRIIGER